MKVIKKELKKFLNILKNISKINLGYILSILILTISSLYLLLNNNNDKLLVFFLNIIFFVPLIIYFKYENKKKIQKKFPLFEIIIILIFMSSFVIFYFDYYDYLFKYIQNDQDIFLKDEKIIDRKKTVISLVLKIYLIAISILLISYYFFRYVLSKIKFVEISLFKNQSNILKLGYSLFAGYFIMDANFYFENITVINELKILFLYTSLLILFYSNNIFNKYLRYILLIFLFFYLSLKTFVMPIISCTIIILSIEWLIKKRINFFVLIIFLLAFYFVNLTKSIHRNNLAIYGNNNLKINLVENINIFMQYSIKKKRVKSLDTNPDQNLNITLLSLPRVSNAMPVEYNKEQQFESLNRRIAMSTQTLVHSILYDEITRNYNGKTIKFAFYSFIPSIVWQSKPSFEFANKFGRDLNFLHKSDLKTSINIPLITELYINYYYKGLLVGMSLLALLISVTEFLISIFLRKDKIFTFILIASTFSFTYIETSAIFIVNGFIVKLLVLLVSVWGLNIILNIFKRS